MGKLLTLAVLSLLLWGVISNRIEGYEIQVVPAFLDAVARIETRNEKRDAEKK